MDIQLPNAFHPAAVVVFQIIGGDDTTHDIVELLRVLQIDLLVHGCHVPSGEFIGSEVIAVFVGAGAAEHETELGVARCPDIHSLGAQAFRLTQANVHGNTGVEVRGSGQRHRFHLLLRFGC